jgi:hypothetical protein
MQPAPSLTCQMVCERQGEARCRAVRRRFAARGSVGGSTSDTMPASDPFASAITERARCPGTPALQHAIPEGPITVADLYSRRASSTTNCSAPCAQHVQRCNAHILIAGQARPDSCYGGHMCRTVAASAVLCSHTMQQAARHIILPCKVHRRALAVAMERLPRLRLPEIAIRPCT